MTAVRTLAELTTLRVGGPITQYYEAHSLTDITEAVREADTSGTPVLMIGGGSNLLASDELFPGLVIKDLRQEISEVETSSCGGATVRVSAGTTWDDFVTHAIEQEWMGVEALSGIPGTIGAAPIQNIGAYGQEVAETLASVRVYDRMNGQMSTLALADLQLGYRDSRLKRSMASVEIGEGRTWTPTGRWIVTEVEFQLRLASLSSPVQYRELANRLGIEIGKRAPAREVRQAVLELRRSKGMVLDSDDHDTWSAGSFFTNPIVSEEEAQRLLPPEAPRFPVEDRSAVASIRGTAPVRAGLVKTSAAWLISHAGIERGFGMVPAATVSTKHVLALTNRGNARSSDIVDLARLIQTRVAEQFGITLVPEPVSVGLTI